MSRTPTVDDVPPSEQPPRTNRGVGRVLVAVYGIFALAATSRAAVQLVTRYH